jgi:DNA-binding transcriptional MerR regulator
LYYDQIGLLRPSGRTFSGYRFYGSRDRRRLERICHYRQAGLLLKEIAAVLSCGQKPGAKILEKRLRETTGEILELKNRQRLLAHMLSRIAAGVAPAAIDKEMWVEMLRAAGMDEAAMYRWHAEFERRAPEGHQEFLFSLGLPPKEVARIRELSVAER